mmetsp:Transcript_14105/g.32325  ORF Transcript_14105/g.32325 Transcript_14105/m.32325 type:complete len:233 (+) Transcript_14105:909-1607(+)
MGRGIKCHVTTFFWFFCKFSLMYRERRAHAVGRSIPLRISDHALPIQLGERFESVVSCEMIELRHVVVIQFKVVKDVYVLLHPVATHTFGNVHDILLDEPTSHHLSRRAPVLFCNVDDRRVLERLAVAQRTVRLNQHASTLELFDGLLTVKQWIHLNLVHQWQIVFGDVVRNEFVVVFECVVGDAHASYESFVSHFEEFLVRDDVPSVWNGPVYAVEVDVVRLERVERIAQG